MCLFSRFTSSLCTYIDISAFYGDYTVVILMIENEKLSWLEYKALIRRSDAARMTDDECV